MKVLITGATGLIGKEIVRQCLEREISVHYLTTRKEKLEDGPDLKGFYWNPAAGEIELQAFSGVGTIINLAGASVSKRWTKQYKQVILKSRIDAIALVYKSLTEIDHQVTQFISASGVGVYPNSVKVEYDEMSTETEDTFLAEVVRVWEEAAEDFQALGMRVATIRTGVVLSAEGGAFMKLMKPIKMGFGAVIGNGKQWQSWIHIKDIAKMYLHIAKNDLQGIYNGVAPHPVTNKKLTKQVASFLKKPLWLPKVPDFVLRIILGEMAILALDGQYVSSKKIEATGFYFQFETLEEALSDLINKKG